MRRLILLDAGPLGLVTNPKPSPISRRCTRWLDRLLAGSTQVLIPEIADYEVRRELLRANRLASLRRLDALKAEIGYLPITTEAMLQAAAFWAQARRQGLPTAAATALDADAILAAQAAVLARNDDSVTIATMNVGHLTRFVDARHWQEIT